MSTADESSQIPSNVSPLRFIMAEAAGVAHRRFETLDAARSDPNAVVIMEGDYGGQIYLTCPVPHVHCTLQALEQLLKDLDESQWNDPDGAGVYFEIAAIGSRVAGGMRGGAIADAVWLHKELEHLRSSVVDVIAGLRPRITI